MLNTPQALISARFSSRPHQSPPSLSDRLNRRNLVLQEHTPRISLFKFKILFLSIPVTFWPIISRSCAHNRHAFCPAVFIRFMVDDFQTISTDILVRHHSATSAFVLNRIFFTWVKRCRASAEQFACWVSVDELDLRYGTMVGSMVSTKKNTSSQMMWLAYQ